MELLHVGLDLSNGEPIWSRNSGLTGAEDYMSFGFSAGTSRHR